eukprot:6000366-Amphidinium_carterae.1
MRAKTSSHNTTVPTMVSSHNEDNDLTVLTFFNHRKVKIGDNGWQWSSPITFMNSDELADNLLADNCPTSVNRGDVTIVNETLFRAFVRAMHNALHNGYSVTLLCVAQVHNQENDNAPTIKRLLP